MPFKIDADIPLPANPPRMKYRWNQMQPGDSVLFTHEPDFAKILNAAYGYARRNNWEVTTRKTEEGLRIWRIT